MFGGEAGPTEFRNTRPRKRNITNLFLRMNENHSHNDGYYTTANSTITEKINNNNNNNNNINYVNMNMVRDNLDETLVEFVRELVHQRFLLHGC